MPINVGVVRAGNWASTVPESLVAEVRVTATSTIACLLVDWCN